MTQYQNNSDLEENFLANLKQRINDFFLLNNPDLNSLKQDSENILKDLKDNISISHFSDILVSRTKLSKEKKNILENKLAQVNFDLKTLKKKDSFDELSLACSPTRDKTNVFLSEAELEESCIKALENISKTVDANLLYFLENYEKTHFTKLPVSQRIRYATPVGEFKVIIEELLKNIFDIKKRISLDTLDHASHLEKKLKKIVQENKLELFNEYVDLICYLAREVNSVEFHLNLFLARKLDEFDYFFRHDKNSDAPIYIHNFKFSISSHVESSTFIRIKSNANIEHLKNMEDSVNLKKSLSTPPLIENNYKGEDCMDNNKFEKVEIRTSLNSLSKKKFVRKNECNNIDEKLEMCEKSCNICTIF